MMQPTVTGFFDDKTFTISYVIWHKKGQECAIIDPVLGYGITTGRTDTKHADQLITFIEENNLILKWILETHIHADHLTSAPYIKERIGGTIAISRQVTVVQSVFGDIFNAGETFALDGSQFDHLFEDGEYFDIGAIPCQAIFTAGHTPACITYICGDAAFVGDTLFMPDYGTARCDFPGGNASDLYHSIQRLLKLPKETRLFMCHDYGPDNREYAWETTIEQQKLQNIHIHDGITEAEFIDIRTNRDKHLSMPQLIIPAVQINMRAGQAPEPEDNGKTYLKVPFDFL